MSLDWTTITACAAHFDVDPNELERQLTCDDPTEPTTWCSMPTNSWRRGLCGRQATVRFAGIQVCWQHENTLRTAFLAWIRGDWNQPFSEPDLGAVVDALGYRFDREIAHADHDEEALSAAKRLREALLSLVRTDAAAEVRDSLARVWGAA